MRASWVGVLLLLGCEGLVGEFGEDEVPGAIVRDWSGPRITGFSCSTTSLETRAPLTCTAAALHPEGAPLTCTLDPGDGQPAVDLGDCSTERLVTLRFGSPGAVRLTLRVTDAAERLATRSLPLEVTGLPNQPPDIGALSASRPAGVAPLRTTVTWTVADPEGDPLRCALDVGADGTVEHPGVDCAAASLAVEARTVGPTPVRLTVTDSGGLVSERTLTLEVQPPTADLRVEAVQFGQTVVKESLALVEGKPALLRVIALANEPGLAATLELEAKVGATVLGRQPLTGPPEVPLAVGPGDLAKSYRAVLPEAWVVPGVELALRLDPADEVLEADEANNARTVRPEVERANEVHLTAVPVVNAGATGTPLDLSAPLTRMWPIRGVEAKTRAPFTYEGTVSATSGSSWAQLLSAIAQVKASDGSSRNYYGFLRASFGGGVAGIGYVGQGAATGRDDSASVATHELGHNFGQNHAPCGGVAGADASYPYPNARLGTWGWNGTQLLDPARYVDLMSYCNPEWVSDYTYERVQRFMAGRGSFAPGAALPAVQREPVVLVAGRFTAAGVELSPVQRFHGAVTEPAEAADAEVRLVTLAGRELRVPVALWATSEADERHFVAVVPDPGELREVSAWRGGVRVASQTAAPGDFAPEATVERLDATRVRVRWAGAASALVAHVADTRTTLAVDARRGEVVVHTDGLEGGAFEVSLSDGVRSRALRLELR